MIFESYSESDTLNFAYELGAKGKAGEIYCMSGDLGCGKTVFAKGFAKGLKVEGIITSPTFTLINQYSGRLPFYHFDVYRIKTVEEMYDLGYEEYFYGDGICLIEWAEIIKPLIPAWAVWITIGKDIDKGASYRKIEVAK